MSKKTDDTGKVRVLVYGTLKMGHGNHVVMEKAQGQFMGYDSITGNYKLTGSSGLPAVVPDLNATRDVRGQVFSMDEEGLAALDLLEGHPNFYRRQKVWTNLLEKRVWVYFLFNEGFRNNENDTHSDNSLWCPSDAELAFWDKQASNA